MSPALADPNLGTTLDDRYRIDHLLALGGMSRIYRAMDKRLHRAVVVKILNDNFASESTVRERFESEAVIAANITHPNVVSIRDHNVTDNIVYLVMEYVRGRNLDQVISERGRFTPRQMLSVLEQVCHGLGAAHSEGIIHRDMKPANVLLADTGEVKVTDFGLARAASAHTQSATLVATLSHVSPELVSGAPADSRSDIYAVGIMIYQMLTGRLPYSETNAAALMKHHLDSPMPLPSDVVPGLATDLDELVQWCTEKDPEKRPQNAELLLDEVIQIRSTLSEEQLDFDADTLGGIEDLTPGSMAHMPTTVQQRLDDWQREREEARERRWQLQGTGATADGYSLDAQPDPEETTTIIAASDATEVLDLRDAQATVVHAPTAGAGSPGADATAAYSRTDIETFGAGEPNEQDPQPAARSPRGEKRATKAAQKQWRKEAQVPTHRLRKPRTAAQKTGFIAAWVLIVALVAAAGWFFGRGPGTVIRIPSLNGLLQEQAVSQMSEQGVPVRLGSAFDDEIAIGRVVDSHPATGENIMKFQGVELIVSQGPERFEIPQVAGKSLQSATELLAQHELTKVKEVREYSSEVEKGKVISSSPAAGKTAARKDAITLTVSKGPAPVQVPALQGLSEDDAAAALESAGLRLQVGDPVYSREVPSGLVAAQSPQNGTAEVGSSVTVNLSQGPEFAQVPSVIGLGVEEATRVLEEAGFTVKAHHVLGDFSQTVRMQSPLNQSIELGSEISIYAF